jgi:hypothetical protein
MTPPGELADFVTVLTAKGHQRATKIIQWHGDLGFAEVLPYGSLRTFSATEETVSGIDDLAALLDRIAGEFSSLITRGKLADGIDRNRMRRLALPQRRSDGTVAEPATLEPATHFWIPLDVDALPCPGWLDPVNEPDQTVQYVTNQLPEEFRGVTCRWEFTSSQATKPGIYIRLFFWSDRRLSDADLKAWLAEKVPVAGQSRNKWPRRWPIDPAIFAPAQPIYVARPIIVSMRDPVPVRSGLWRGDRDKLTPPIIGKARLAPHQSGARVASAVIEAGHDNVTPKLIADGPESPPTLRRAGVGYEGYRASIGDHESGSGFFAPIKSAVASWIAEHGARADTEPLRADLERAIRQAPRDRAKHPDDYVEIRVRDLESLIAAIRELQRASEAARQQQPRCEPTYAKPLATLEEAEEHICRALDEFAAAAAAWRTDLSHWAAAQSLSA